MNRIKLTKVFSLLLIAGIWSACSSQGTSENEQKVIEGIESIESELDQASDELDAEIEDMNHDVDSLLEGI